MEAHGKPAADSSLMANPVPNAPLFFWQLYSVLGADRIEEIVRCFYTRVHADQEETWLRDAFIRLGSLEHHVAVQADFWIDAFGGGRQYHGAEYRIGFHHTYSPA